MNPETFNVVLCCAFIVWVLLDEDSLVRFSRYCDLGLRYLTVAPSYVKMRLFHLYIGWKMKRQFKSLNLQFPNKS